MAESFQCAHFPPAIMIRKAKYLNNIVERDHRGVNRVTLPMLGFKFV